jgi:hypothetical protein
MTKISQFSDMGSALSREDLFVIQESGVPSGVVKKVSVSGLLSYYGVEPASYYSDIMVDTTPFIWNQTNDTYYEYKNSINTSSFAGPAVAGAGYTTQPDLRVQSSMRRVGLHPSGYVTYHLDGEDSELLAGSWLKIYEGENKAGNGTTNNYIRQNLGTWASGTVYVLRDRVVHSGGVWECIVPTVSGVTPAAGTVSASGIIRSVTSGNVMVEVPEFFVRVDWTDGLSWKNIAGADVGGQYKTLSPSGTSPLDPLRVYYVLPKQQYDLLPSPEKAKFIRHPALWASGDTDAQRTVYIDGLNPTVFEASPYTTQRDASGVTRVWNGSAFGYYTSSGTATTSGDFNEASALRYRYIAAYQCTTDGTRLRSITASGVYVSHTRATGLTRARAVASGWTNGDYALWNACQLLTAMEYRNFFIQDPTVGIGRGRDGTGWTPNNNTGYRDYQLGILNDKGNRTFNNTTDGRHSTAGADQLAAMQWRGIEHYYGGTWRWCHGINVNAGANGQVYIALNPNSFADSTTAGFVDTSNQLSTAANDAYIGGFKDDVGLFFFPDEGGTSSTYITDIRYGAFGTSGWRTWAVGASASPGECGPWASLWFAPPAVNPGANFGSLLSR